MKIAKKIRVILLLVFCCFLALETNVKAEEWIVTPERQKTGYKFECGDYSEQNYISVDKFNLRSNVTGEQRIAYCIQKNVSTHLNVSYVMQEMDVNNLSISNLISTYAWADGNNTAINYFNDLSSVVKKSLNIASMWEKTYYPGENAAIVATQWFMWAQTTGCSSAFQANQSDNPKNPIPRRDDGYKFLDMNYSWWQVDKNNDGILSANGIGRPHSDYGK